MKFIYVLEGELTVSLNKMPKCSKFKRFCKLENIPDIHGNCRNEIVSMFEQKMLKGWWPLYKEVDGKRKLCVRVAVYFMNKDKAFYLKTNLDLKYEEQRRNILFHLSQYFFFFGGGGNMCYVVLLIWNSWKDQCLQHESKLNGCNLQLISQCARKLHGYGSYIWRKLFQK